MKRGLFVAFEGVEGAGKSTQVGMLAEWLRSLGCETLMVREPGGTPLAEQARSLLLHGAELGPATELFLFLTARADLVDRVIRPALAGGQVVIADRFELSTRAYQVAGRGLDESKVRAAIDLATGGLAPDIYLVLDVPAATGRARQEADGKNADRIERADPAFHERVAAAFAAAREPGLTHINAGLPSAAVHRMVREAVSPLLAERGVPGLGAAVAP